ncbi:hypothetical protein CASFOL_006162 [Castilleja foliolosa]|uniref:Tripeptidyl-peptidase II n=1 Tax=Castilleja foliolosa TaxID=1961234 RepID=A0ABD3E9L0_9LAMI
MPWKCITHYSSVHLIWIELRMMRGFYLLISFNLLLLFSFLEESNINAAKSKSNNNNNVYIVYMGGLNSRNGVGKDDHNQLLSELMGRKKSFVVHIYNNSFLGFAARLPEDEAKSIGKRQGVVSVFPNRVLQLHTTRSWDFLTMNQNDVAFKNDYNIAPMSSQSSQVSWSTGSDTIIGVIDTGIWPESPSFNDEFMGPIPRRWKGTCISDGNITCNRKLIGARYYDDTTEPGYIVTARDEEGHGTHTASIAAGRPVHGASYYGLAKGTARGGSPDSRLAAYRVVGPDGGADEVAVLRAFDDAIADGVDVLSISLGSFGDNDIEEGYTLNSTIAIGAFHAVEKGIVVVGSAGNDGPSRATIDDAKTAPWILTVAATSIDREFVADIVLGHNKGIVKGGGINFSGLNKSAVYQLVDGRAAGSNQNDLANASNCIPGALDSGKVKDKIVLCENKDKRYKLITKFKKLKSQGAIGMIMIDDVENKVPFKYGTFPITAVSEVDGSRIRTYINSTSIALATILPTRTVIPGSNPAPSVAVFSSRGPAMYHDQKFIKPDIAAPGLGIIAAWPTNDTRIGLPDMDPPLFNILSGTSMACPHVSGLAARVKSAHPTWSPSAIKSAIMTTATQRNNRYAPITTDNGSIATPYEIGSGEINLSGPLCPGLVYETTTIDYIQFLCNLGYNISVIRKVSATVPVNFSCPANPSSHLISDMNYPSISVSGLKANETRTVKRTVTNVGEVYSSYTAIVQAPTGLHVQVVPNKLHFTKNLKKLTFQVTFKLTTTSLSEDLFGSFSWYNWKHNVRSPFVASIV